MSELREFDQRSERVLLGWDDEELDRVVSSDMPITPLGHRDGNYYVIARSGEIRCLDTRAMTPLGLVSLFDGDSAWLAKVAPKLDKEGNPTGQFVTQSAAQKLISLCAAMGLYSARTAVRGPGFWPDAEGAILHCGDILIRWTDSGPVPVKAGIRVGRAVYPAYPPTPYAARKPASADEGATLLKALNLWPWESGDLAAELALGWIGAALMGAVTNWHPHFLVAAKRGSGKTWLSTMISDIIGVELTNNFSEASLRQDRASEARGVVLDESESGGRFDRVIELIRHMASAGGAKVMRGSAGGAAQHYTVTGSVWMAAINPPALLPQDRSRITEVGLMKLPERPMEERAAHEARVIKAMAWARDNAPFLRARAAAGWRRYLANLAEWRKALMSLGADARQADQLGGLLAGRDLMLSDYVTTEAEAQAGAALFAGMVRQTITEDEENSEAQRCLNHLMSFMVEAWQGGTKATVGHLVMNALDHGDAEVTAKQALPAYGVRIEPPAPPLIEEPYMLVANGHSGLDRIFQNTEWKDGAWSRALKGLAGAAAGQAPVWFAGSKARSTLIPLRHLPTKAASFADVWGSPATPQEPPEYGDDVADSFR